MDNVERSEVVETTQHLQQTVRDLRAQLAAAEARGREMQQGREWAFAALHGDALFGDGTEHDLVRAIRQGLAAARAEGVAEATAIALQLRSGSISWSLSEITAAEKRIAAREVRGLSDEIMDEMASIGEDSGGEELRAALARAVEGETHG